MAEETSYHMTPDEFRRRGLELVDWIADYQERVDCLLYTSDAADE